MKYISKNHEPVNFADWKKSQVPGPTWTAFYGSPAKAAVHKSLIEEQGHICCYCEQRTQPDDSHIEHLKPRSAYRALELEYCNLLASCNGENNAEIPRRDRHCGHRKNQWYNNQLMVSPLDPSCEEYFRYTLYGEILATDDQNKAPAAEETIQRLGLDSANLNKGRKSAIAGLNALGPLTAQKAAELIQGFKNRDVHGRYTPFCTAIVYVLERHFSDVT